MKVLSLFDGISCGRVALERAGLHVSRYVAYEIDQDAINVSAWNWPEIEHEGSVEGADFTKYKGFDMVIGGFPCTDLSIGKNNREGLKGKHSRLFWEQVRAIKEINPRYFLVENNYGMPKKDEAIITETLGVEPIYINSALVSGQSRRRLYWTNIPGVEVPEDRNIYLKDVLEEQPPLKYYHSNGALEYLTRTETKLRFAQADDKDKSNCLLAVYSKGVPYNVLFEDPVRVATLREKDSQGGRLYGINGKAIACTTNNHNIIAVPYGLAFRTRNTEQGRFKKPEVRIDGKANALTTVQTDSMVVEPPLKAYCLQASSGKKTISDIPKKRHTPIYEYPRPGVPLFKVEGGLLEYKERQIPVKLTDGFYAIRKLTPVECERLQTLPDGYTEMVSDTQRYRQLGNGWTVDVIAHIFNHIHLDNLL